MLTEHRPSIALCCCLVLTAACAPAGQRTLAGTSRPPARVSPGGDAHIPGQVRTADATAAGEVRTDATPPSATRELGASETYGASSGGRGDLPEISDHATARPGNLPGTDHATARELAGALALLRSDPNTAAARLEPLTGEGKLLADFALFYRGRALAKSNPSAARASLQSMLDRFGNSQLRYTAAAELAEMYEAAGNSTAATAIARKHGRGSGNTLDKARMWAAAGRASSSVDVSGAAARLTEARRIAPQARAGRAAASALKNLHASHPSLQPSDADALYKEAQLLSREGRWTEGKALCDRLLARHPGYSNEMATVLMAAKALSKSDGRIPAAEMLERLAGSAPNSTRKARYLYEAAYHRWNGDDNSGARRLFERFVQIETNTSRTGGAWYAIGRIHESAGRTADAVAAYRKAAAFGTSRERGERRWRAGWAHYLAGNLTAARDNFAVAVDKAPPRNATAGRGEALYWHARTLERTGATTAARERYRRLLGEFPIGYYAYAIHRRHGMEAPAIRATGLPKDPAIWNPASDRAWRRSATLHAAGLRSEAAEEIRLRVAGMSSTEQLRWLPWLPDAEAYRAGFGMASSLKSRNRLSLPKALPYIYPKPYADIVRREARLQGVDPWLVVSLMRQESLFDPRIVSPADAVGLMQLLESTAKRMAPLAGMGPVDRDNLYDPETNIRLGVAYLGKLSREFGGDPVWMLAAYNAGERAAARWQRSTKGLDQDEKIERISYRETRGYVKRVLANLRNYTRVHGTF